ncbi:pseudaminic acid biosynthesis-associated methylase [Baaleninema simplex]|uniref:pseudaminic acid biosynthesis-associated methylase n=1 Tax=Baaleninema simplex TaxID=2862350 RepID=UPI00035E0E33|nr:pseudaminic acid biosynthesis-associated methylase [Baaleninema simplex]
MNSKKFQTEQEEFWAGKFGTDYIARNTSRHILASNLSFFAHALRSAQELSSCLELGANVGMNLQALALLYPDIHQFGVEINLDAAKQLEVLLGRENVFNGSIFNFSTNKTFDLVLIKGVLIHINPDMLDRVYHKIYSCTNRYILLCEYYNPAPMEVIYRGHSGKLFKRDFAGEMLDQFSRLKLVDYGFVYHRDATFPQDDITWFLIEKIE